MLNSALLSPVTASFFCILSFSLSLPLTVFLLIISEKPRAVRSDLLPSHPPLPPHAHAGLHPVPQPHQSNTHPAGARRPVTQQAVLLIIFFLLPCLLLRLIPSVFTQFPAVPLQFEPCLTPMLPPTAPASVFTLPHSPVAHWLTILPHHGDSSDQLRLRGHPGLRGHGFSSHRASVRPLPPLSPPAPADNGGSTRCQRRQPSSKQTAQDR